jgi:ankyrin repeat protein
MRNNEMDVKRAGTYDEIEPLIKLCKAGRLFEVQDWISAGKPVNVPLEAYPRRTIKSPLHIAIEGGFHSLVQLLFDGGAALEEPRYSPLLHTLEKRRLDLLELLVRHGADIRSVSMENVFGTWSSEIVEFFIERGADLETGNPLADALCSRIRPALGIFKRYKDRFPSFQEQINIALRHHCKEGNLKWVSLMLWAGADPYAQGPYGPYDDDPDDYNNALELAAFYGHHDIFKLKQIRLDPEHSYAERLLENVCYSEKADVLKMLIDKGFSPENLQDKGSLLIQSLLLRMSYHFNFFTLQREDKNINSSESREQIKMIHLLARNGAKWQPQDRSEVNHVRRSLMKMEAHYAMEFVWIMSEYNACSKSDIELLMKNPTMHSLVSKYQGRLDEMMRYFRDY